MNVESGEKKAERKKKKTHRLPPLVRFSHAPLASAFLDLFHPLPRPRGDGRRFRASERRAKRSKKVQEPFQILRERSQMP